jgi:hypothetical protein
MSIAKRVGDVEDNLTPKEAVICWMREAHQFDSLLTYGRWLLEQPEEAYPLIRMPRQVVAAVRARNKGTSDVLLRDEFYRVQKDVVFLYHLHKQVNMQALQDEEALRLKVTLLSEKLRGLIHRIWAIDALRLERLQFPGDLSAPLPKRRRKKTTEEVDLNEAIDAWPGEELMLWGEVVAFQEAVQLISRRYLGGEELLFPQSAHRLQATLDILAVMRDVHRTMISRRPPQSEAGFLRWVLEEETPESPAPPAVSPDPLAEKRPDTRAAARSLAEHHVLMARAEALEALGERDAGIRLVENWLRSRA